MAPVSSFIFLSLADVCSSSRTMEVGLGGEVAEQTPSAAALVDISRNRWYTSYEELGLGRCCCDASDGWFDRSTRTDRCKLFDGMHGSCSSISDPDFGGADSPRSLSGRRHTSSGGCTVLSTEVAQWRALAETAVASVQDVTAFVNTFESRDVLCCCDAFPLQSLLAPEFDANKTRCGLFLNRHNGDCSSVEAVDFTWQELQQIPEFDADRLRPHSSTRMEKCVMNSGTGQIDIMARLVLGAYGPDDYCKATRMIGPIPGHPSVAASPFGRRADVLCDPGFEPEGLYTSCEYHNLQLGLYEPALACQPRREHCQALYFDGGDAHNLSIPATTYDERRNVSCSTGWEAEVQQVHCRVDEHFSPVPSCVRIAGWCPPHRLNATSQNFQVRVPEARVGLQSVVQCQIEFGLVPEYEEVTCSLDHTFSPAPRCIVDTDFCHAEEGTSANGGLAISQAAWGDKREVTCGEGFLPALREVTCHHAEGVGPHFEPIAECQIDCTSVPTRLASRCGGPSQSTGACFTGNDDLKLWDCWGTGDEQRSAEWCREAGFAGACVFETPYQGSDGETLPPQDACTDLIAYDEQCGDHPESSYIGACFVETSAGSETLEGSWACITGETFRTADCLMKAVPDEVFEALGDSTYASGCVF